MSVFGSGRVGPVLVPAVAMDHHRESVPGDAVSVVVPTPVSTEQVAALLYGALTSQEAAACGSAAVREVLAEWVAGGGSGAISDAVWAVEEDRRGGVLDQTAHWSNCQQLAETATGGWATESGGVGRCRFGPVDVAGVRMDHHRAGVSDEPVVRVAVAVPVSTEQAAALLYDTLETSDVAGYSRTELRQHLTELVAGGGAQEISYASWLAARDREQGTFAGEHWARCEQRAGELIADAQARMPQAAEHHGPHAGGVVAPGCDSSEQTPEQTPEETPGRAGPGRVAAASGTGRLLVPGELGEQWGGLMARPAQPGAVGAADDAPRRSAGAASPSEVEVGRAEAGRRMVDAAMARVEASMAALRAQSVGHTDSSDASESTTARHTAQSSEDLTAEPVAEAPADAGAEVTR